MGEVINMPIKDSMEELDDTPNNVSLETPIDNNKAFHLLELKQHVNDIRKIKDEIIDKRVNVLNDDEISNHLDNVIENLSIEKIKSLTETEINLIYMIEDKPIELDIAMSDKTKSFEFKRDFLIYRKESSLALAEIDEALEKMNQEMVTNELELNTLLTEFGDLSTYIRQKLTNDYNSAITEDEKNKFSLMLKNFDDSLTLNVLFDHYSKYSVKNTISDYYTRAEGIYSNYLKTMKKLNIKNNLTHFENLEVKYLPEKYHKYPNLFLFAVIKYFAYKKNSVEKFTDGIFLTQFTVNLKKLYSDDFHNDEMKETFINSIQKVLDLFFYN